MSRARYSNVWSKCQTLLQIRRVKLIVVSGGSPLCSGHSWDHEENPNCPSVCGVGPNCCPTFCQGSGQRRFVHFLYRHRDLNWRMVETRQNSGRDSCACRKGQASSCNGNPIVDISNLYHLLLFRFVQPWFYPCWKIFARISLSIPSQMLSSGWRTGWTHTTCVRDLQETVPTPQPRTLVRKLSQSTTL